jgi:diaminopimelate decarboxylase
MTDRRQSGCTSTSGFPVVDGALEVGGMPLPRLAARVGSTPFFAYDRRLISERVELLQRHLPSSVHLSYAVKANPMPAVVQHMAGLVDGFDVASAGELKLVLDTTMPAERISFAGPGKRRTELVQAVVAEVTLNLESETEMEVVSDVGEQLGIRPRGVVRVNPNFELRASGLRMAGGAKQFGVDAERVPGMLRRMRELDLAFQGFHVFTGSQNLSASAIREAQQKTIELCLDLAQHAPTSVRTLNIGGGFGIPYFPGDQPLDIAAVGEGLAWLMPKVEARFPEARVVVELGRYLVGEAGIYVCRVVDRKVSRGEVFLVTDGGLHHQLAASGNFGQVVRRNYPVTVGNKVDSPRREVANVVGCLCTPLDLLASKAELPQADTGDLIVIFQSGAYGFSASPAAFLSHPVPVEVLV